MNRFRLLMLGAATSLILAATAARADIVVGVAGPLTGSEAVFGEQFSHGASKAVDDINKKGGLLGQKLVLKSGDDACDPKQAVSVANDMASAGAAVVIGHFCSGSSIPASDVYAESNIIQISPGSTNPDFTERGLPNVFRVCGRDDAQGPIAAEYVQSHFKGKTIAIVQDKSTYGQGLADQFKAKLNALGTKEVLYDSITAGDKDFSPLVSKLKQANVDVLYFGGYKTEAGLITRQLREQGLKTILVSGDALVTDEYWAITGDAGQGTLMTFGPDPRLNPVNKTLVEEFRADKYEPEAYTLYTYAALQAWADAVTKAGTTDATKVAAELKKDKFSTALGEIQFDAKGDNKAPGYVVYEWNNGKYAYVKN
ncbi:MAG: branched-chain amino acid ABC transporter substrate-binding protein [Parvibaculaceae bacterium]|nr:branched-chain amino acid ABC transporter substrate-binding protein [Parvibaculaceae bacterium]